MILSTYIQLINIDPSTFSLNTFKRNSLKLSFSVNLSEYSPFDETIILEPTRGKVFMQLYKMKVAIYHHFLIFQHIQISLHVLECPAGYTLLRMRNSSEHTCYCNLHHKYIMSCNGSNLQLKVSLKNYFIFLFILHSWKITPFQIIIKI